MCSNHNPILKSVSGKSFLKYFVNNVKEKDKSGDTSENVKPDPIVDGGGRFVRANIHVKLVVDCSGPNNIKLFSEPSNGNVA